MATKQFALPLDENSKQSGDITFKKLTQNGAPVEFRLTNVGSGSTNQLNLITHKGGQAENHIFATTVSQAVEDVVLSHSQMAEVYSDAVDGDWDYIEASWTAGAVDTPNKSNTYMVQGGRTYDIVGWPPN